MSKVYLRLLRYGIVGKTSQLTVFCPSMCNLMQWLPETDWEHQGHEEKHRDYGAGAIQEKTSKAPANWWVQSCCARSPITQLERIEWHAGHNATGSLAGGHMDNGRA